ncbi:MAG TPA: transcriptional repressor LexA [Clostridia bacterium]|jgi:repressor LexA|nr:transcriptional repressor LexA [Clostridia bacterium]HRX41693.1 transcriptional repressor LexA [Clostridia bacterium]
MSNKSTEKQEKVLEYIKETISEKGYSPSVRDICSDLGIKSTSTVHAYLKKLVDSGSIIMDNTISRSIRLPEPLRQLGSSDLVEVPIVGQVAAGSPILAQENIEDTFTVSSAYTRNATVFMLKVKGNSMIEAGILEGDLILVKQQATAANGDIVVAVLEDEATVKTYYKEKNHIRLQPENSSMEPIIVTDDIIIAGKVIGLFRSY